MMVRELKLYGVAILNYFLPLGALALLLPFYSNAVLGEDLNLQQSAEWYLDTIQQDKIIKIWPTKLRAYELINNSENNETEYKISKKNNNYINYSESNIFPPKISIYIYQSKYKFGFDEYLYKSKLLPNYKSYVATLPLFDEPCSFTYLLGKRGWVAGGVIFIDGSEIEKADARTECISAGLDLISGFPADANSKLSDLPDPMVRDLILQSVLLCSLEGDSRMPNQERSRDGFTPKPPMACVKSKISELDIF